MEHYMPEIFWHDRTPLLSVDICSQNNPGKKYKLVTASMQKEIRIWEFSYESSDHKVDSLAVDFIANLTGHNSAVNIVRFSPAGSGSQLLASGDADGRIFIWQLNPHSSTSINLPSEEDGLPPNKENWVRIKTMTHDEDIAAITWCPNGKLLATVSRDNALCIHEAVTGKRVLTLRGYRQYANGISWDPLGKYIATMSTDRKLDVIDCVKGTKLRTFGMVDLPAASFCGIYAEAKPYRLFHDDQLNGFQRGVAFSPCGQLLVAPAGHLEVGTADVYGTFVFKRADLKQDKPLCFLPSQKQTFLVRMCPVLMELMDSEENYSGLPYRVIWLSLSKDTVVFYDSQHSHPIAYVDNIHYNNLTDVAWSCDGNNVIVSSLEGYNSFLRLKLSSWGTEFVKDRLPCPPPSPQLIQVKKRKPKEKKEGETANENVKDTPEPLTPKGKVQSVQSGTPGGGRKPASNPGTPKSTVNLKKFFRTKTSEVCSEEGSTPDKDQNTVNGTTPKKENTVTPTDVPSQIEVRKQKRIQLITLTD